MAGNTFEFDPLEPPQQGAAGAESSKPRPPGRGAAGQAGEDVLAPDASANRAISDIELYELSQGLESAASAPTAGGAVSTAPEAAVAPDERAWSAVAPPAPPTMAAAAWSGRTAFADLFVPDAAAVPASRLGVGTDERMELLRDKLRRSEALVARFREAWRTRESEIDILEALLQQEVARSADASARVVQLTNELQGSERLLEQVKQDLSDRDEQLATMTQRQQEAQSRLQEELEGQQSRMAQLSTERAAEVGALRTQLEEAQSQLAAMRAAHAQEEGLWASQLRSRDDELAQAQAQTAELRRQIEVQENNLTETRAAFERDLLLRQEAIENLKTSIENQREAFAQRDEQIEKLSDQLAARDRDLAMATQEIDQRENTMMELRDEVRRAQEANAARDEAIEKLNQSIHAQRQVLAEKEIRAQEALQAQVDKSQREFRDAEVQWQETAEELRRGIALRNEAIDRLKAAVESNKSRTQSLDGEVAALRQHLANMEHRTRAERERVDEILVRSRRALDVAQKLLS